MTNSTRGSGMLMGLTTEGLNDMIKEIEEELKQEQGEHQ